VAAPKARAKTGAATPANKKTATVAEPVAVKKVAAKKPAAPVVEAKKAKPPAVKKTPTPAADTKVPVKKPVAAKAKPAAADKKLAAKPSPEQRYLMVQTAAYFIAEKHGFQGRSDWHWAEAEREIAEKLDK